MLSSRMLTCYKLFVSKLRVIAKTLFQNDPGHIKLPSVDILEPTEVRLNSVHCTHTTNDQKTDDMLLSTSYLRNVVNMSDAQFVGEHWV